MSDSKLPARDAADRVVSPFEQLAFARKVLSDYAAALGELGQRLGGEFCQACRMVLQLRGSVVVSGMGKAGLIGQKVAATLASTGARSHFLHPAEAIHGDLGRIGADDLVLLFSQSGETEEVVRLLPSLAEMNIPLIAVTSRRQSTLAQAATLVLELGPLKEACPLGLAPSTSAMAMLALGDCLALAVSRSRGFSPRDFVRFHPGGSLGMKLSRADEQMRPLAECRVASIEESVRDVLVRQGRPGRRTGAIMLVDSRGHLAGLFTDSDLARLFENRRDEALDRPIGEVMTSRPASVTAQTPLPEAVALLADKRISELPVVDSEGRPVGLIDITDVVALLPEEGRLPAPLARSA